MENKRLQILAGVIAVHLKDNIVLISGKGRKRVATADSQASRFLFE